MSCVLLLLGDWSSSTLQVAERAQVLGSGLLAKGCKPNPEQFVGIFAQNRPEVWGETDYSNVAGYFFFIDSIKAPHKILLLGHTQTRTLKYGLFGSLCQSWNVCWFYSVFLPPVIDDLQLSRSHFFNTSSCQTKSQCWLSLIVFCFWPLIIILSPTCFSSFFGKVPSFFIENLYILSQ